MSWKFYLEQDYSNLDYLNIDYSNIAWNEYERLCLAITDPPVLKTVSTANPWCAVVQAMIVTDQQIHCVHWSKLWS